MGDFMIKLLFHSFGIADVTIMIAIRSWRDVTIVDHRHDAMVHSPTRVESLNRVQIHASHLIT